MKKKHRGCGCGFLIFVTLAVVGFLGWRVISTQIEDHSLHQSVQTSAPKTDSVSTPRPTVKPASTPKPISTPSPEPTQASEPGGEAAEPEVTEQTESRDDGIIDPDFKAAMDSYEAFFDTYADCLQRMKADPTNFTVLSEYNELMGQYADTMEKLDALGEEEMTDAELGYYIEVTGRIEQKLLTAAE